MLLRHGHTTLFSRATECFNTKYRNILEHLRGFLIRDIEVDSTSRHNHTISASKQLSNSKKHTVCTWLGRDTTLKCNLFQNYVIHFCYRYMRVS